MSKPTVESGSHGRQVGLAAGSDVDDAALLIPPSCSVFALPFPTRSRSLSSASLHHVSSLEMLSFPAKPCLLLHPST